MALTNFDTPDLEIFKYGTKQLLAALTDDIEDSVATHTVLYALQAAGEDTAKLKALVNIFYETPSSRSELSGKLLATLLNYKSDYASAEVPKGELSVASSGRALIRTYALNICQVDFRSGQSQYVWPSKPMLVTTALFRAGHAGQGRVIRDILSTMVASKHFFMPLNFEQFLHVCITCGPRLDEHAKIDSLTSLLNTVATKASNESWFCKLTIAGLISTRESGWVTETRRTPQSLTPVDGCSEDVSAATTPKVCDACDGITKS